jgi:hypothetical protein
MAQQSDIISNATDEGIDTSSRDLDPQTLEHLGDQAEILIVTGTKEWPARIYVPASVRRLGPIKY